MRLINFFVSKFKVLFRYFFQYLNKKNFENDFKNSGCYLGFNTRFFKPEKIKLGNNLFIGDNVFINCGKGGTVTVGDNTSLAQGVKILSWYKESLPSFPDNIIAKDVVIGKCCRIGYDAIIMPGVTIGDYSKVTPLSVVYTDVPPNGVAMGNPAQIIK